MRSLLYYRRNGTYDAHTTAHAVIEADGTVELECFDRPKGVYAPGKIEEADPAEPSRRGRRCPY